MRGFRNKPKSDTTKVFNLDELATALKVLAKGTAQINLTKDVLKTSGLLSKNFKGAVKVLGNGEISVPVSVSGLEVSKSAKIKIEKAGGKVEVLKV